VLIVSQGVEHPLFAPNECAPRTSFGGIRSVRSLSSALHWCAYHPRQFGAVHGRRSLSKARRQLTLWAANPCWWSGVWTDWPQCQESFAVCIDAPRCGQSGRVW